MSTGNAAEEDRTEEKGRKRKKTRRGNGEGAIYERKDRKRKWVGSVDLPNGRRRTFSAITKEEVQDWLKKATLEAQQGILLPAADETLAQYLERWLRDEASQRLRPRTLRRYTELIRLHVIPSIGNVRLDKVGRPHLLRLYREAGEKGLCPATVHYIHRVLHVAFRDAIRGDHIARNPCDLVDPPPKEDPDVVPFTKDEAAAVLRAAQGHRLYALLLMALLTGMRQGEILGLQWEDLDLDPEKAQGLAQIRRSLGYLTGRGFIFGPPKTAKSRRRVSLSPSVVSALVVHRERQNEERAAAGAAWREHGLVFCSRNGSPIHHSNLYHRLFQPIVKELGIVGKNFHGLRHTCATLMYARGDELKTISDLLGHSSVRITADLYAHPVIEVQRQAVQGLDEMVMGALRAG